jgi:hypothetical protein
VGALKSGVHVKIARVDGGPTSSLGVRGRPKTVLPEDVGLDVASYRRLDGFTSPQARCLTKETAVTPIAGFIFAVVAGLMVRNGRRAVLVVLVPWLIVLAYQSFYIASGRAISPPSTVTDFPSASGYWLVQAIILALALGIAALLGSAQARRCTDGDRHDLTRRTEVASALCLAASVLIIVLGFIVFPHQGGTVSAGHHSQDGSPPLIGQLGLLLSFATCAVLGAMTLRRSRATRHSGRPGQPAHPA